MLAKRETQDRASRRRGLALMGLVVVTWGCGDVLPTEPEVQASYQVVATTANAGRPAVHFAGEVEVVWNGGQGSGPSAGADRTAWATLSAFPGVPEGNPGPGRFNYQVRSADGTLHREIGVKLSWARLEEQTADPSDIRWVGVVVSDTKPCAGSQHGADGCGDGCSHDDGTTHDDGGCTHDDGTTNDDGGCAHDDGTDHDGGGCAGNGDPGGGGGHVSGSDCRIGQVVIGWALDAATPALSAAGDRISWKWFAPDAPKVLEIQSAIAHGTDIPWPCKLCEKEILGGNLVLNLRKQ